MSYRLNQRDEDDVRYWLGRDVLGDLGVRSSGSNYESHLLYEPILNDLPYRYVERHKEEDGSITVTVHGTEDVGLRCGPVLVKPKRPHYVDRGAGEELVAISERDRRLQRIWWLLDRKHALVLEQAYGGGRTLPALEVFAELAPLVCETMGAFTVHLRDKDAGTRFEAMMGLGERLRRRKFDQKGDKASEADLDLQVEIETEADLRLSAACREYSSVADREYGAKKADKERGVG